jgi:8-oxo-dGTP pyrophosphatase MutT (NUDIX family)
MAHTLTLADVQRALALAPFDHEAAWLRMAPRPRRMERPDQKPGDARAAAVLLLLYPGADGLSFVLTRRSDDVSTHKGQISLPGGAVDPEDGSTAEAALREACEELNLCEDDVRLLGALTPLYVIVSDFEISPLVGALDARPEFVPNPAEVAEVIEMPVAALLDDQVKASERWQVQGMSLDVPFYQVGEHAVWGATAIILSEFEARLREALGRPER